MVLGRRVPRLRGDGTLQRAHVIGEFRRARRGSHLSAPLSILLRLCRDMNLPRVSHPASGVLLRYSALSPFIGTALTRKSPHV